MTDFYIGQNLTHPMHGPCTVTFIGSDYVGIEIGDGQQGLVKKQSFLETLQSEGQPMPPDIRPYTWPESTFIYEGDEASHYPDAHWEAFFDDPKTIIESNFPEIVKNAQPWIGGVNQKAPRPLPEGWVPGDVRAWPNDRQGLMAVISHGERNVLRDIYPFITDGSQHTLILRQVNVWENGVEAQIEADLGESTITFFDVAYTKHRLWYEAGKSYEFILGGIVYGARPAEDMEMKVSHNPDQIAWQRQLAEKKGEPDSEIPSVISLRGMAMLMPIPEWDVDDYHFRGPVKRVKDAVDVLGQPGWFVSVTVMRFGDDEKQLDILITRRAWKGNAPPFVGQDIEGSFWLQGYLWWVQQ